MSLVVSDLNARARGMATRLLAPQALEQLASSRGLEAFAAGLGRHGYPLEGRSACPAAELDQLIGELAGRRMDLLAVWSGGRAAALRALFERREIATLRMMARGVAEGAAPSARLRGVIPSKRLPGPLLSRLAAAATFGEFHRVLARAGHPAADAFLGAVGGAQRADLLHHEYALRQWWGRRLRTGVRRAGPGARRLVEETIDWENAMTLLLASAWGVEVAPEVAFLAGGRAPTRQRFLELAREPDTDRRRVGLAGELAGTAAGAVLADAGVTLEAIPRRALAARIRSARREAHLAPLDLAPLVEVVLRIEAEAHDLRRLVHAVALGAPPALAVAGLVAA